MNYNDFILRRIGKYFFNISIDLHNATTNLSNVSYAYFPTEIDFISEALNIIKSRETEFQNMKFLDAGSGIGNVCGVAMSMGLNAEGIELNPVLFNISKQIYPEIKFHEMNILEFNNYSDFDIIFYFIPIADDELQLKLKMKIENDIRIGGYIIVRDVETKDDRFIAIDTDNLKNKVWQKIK